MESAIETIIKPRRRDLGGFTVGRVLPHARRRMVGPFIFFDEMGPADFPPETGIDVRPHPHIGLATLTYLFAGEIRHKDNLGYDQIIRPGDVNWMTAGRGIVHSERSTQDALSAGQHLHGLQSWIALPDEHAETEPSFHHHPRESLPLISGDNIEMRIIAGSAFGEESPAPIYSPMFYVAINAGVYAKIKIPESYEQRALYLVSGSLSIEGESYGPGQMIVFAPETTPEIDAKLPSRIMLLGGEPLGPRQLWWNFVATSQERIDRAKADWASSAKLAFNDAPFSLPHGEHDFIPLPDQ